jgi:hypothetical protein
MGTQTFAPLFDAAGNLIGFETSSGRRMFPAALVGAQSYNPGQVPYTPGSGGGGSGLPTYLGIVSSRSGVYSGYNPSGPWQSMSRVRHIAMDSITSLQVVWGNFAAPASTSVADVAAGTLGQNTWTASIEYPVGTIIPVTFGGANSGSVAGGGLLVSDPVAVTLPRGTPFYVRCFYNSTWGNLNVANPTLCGVAPAAAGEWCVNAASGVVDNTKTTVNLTSTSTGLNGQPNAIIGQTKRPTFYLAGDSRMGWGSSIDPTPNWYGNTGDVPRAIGKQWGIFNAAKSGESYSQIIASGSPVAGFARYRIQFAQYCSHIISGYGINDIVLFSQSAATVLANATALANYFGKPFFHETLSPRSSSTDSWATLANQTTDPTNAVRVAFNDAMRLGYGPPFSGYLEIADLTESARDSGLWKVTGSAFGYTPDGLHCNAFGNQSLIEFANNFSVLPDLL